VSARITKAFAMAALSPHRISARLSARTRRCRAVRDRESDSYISDRDPHLIALTAMQYYRTRGAKRRHSYEARGKEGEGVLAGDAHERQSVR
jgi:hypothetical protein